MKNLTKGYPAKVILLFALPLIFGNVCQHLYNLADCKIVSMCLGEDALGAIGAVSVIAVLMTGFINGLTQGFSILIASCFGGEDYGRMRKIVAGTILLTTGFALVMTIVGEISIGLVLEGLHTPEDFFADSEQYIRIIIGGFIFCSFYNLFANMLRAVGNSTCPLICLVISILLNVVLDFFFIWKLHWGIAGAAYATITSQAVAALLVVGYTLWKYQVILPKGAEWKLEEGQYGMLLASGLSMALMNCIVSIGTVVLQGAINSLGKPVVTAHTAGRRVFDILMTFIFTVGIAMTTYVSQNIGAGRLDRVKQGVRHAMIIVTVLTTLLVAVCFLWGEGIIRWVASTDDREILKNAIMYNKVGILFFYVLGFLFIFRCSLQGMGQKIVPVISSVLELLVKVASAMFLVPWLKYFGVALTEPISWIVMTIWLAISYVLALRKLEREEAQDK